MNDAALALVEDYRRIARRMRHLPFYNAALAVEAVAFRPWRGGLAGVLVTPWCMNLVLMGDAAAAVPAAAGRLKVRLPAGEYAFTPGPAEDAVPHLALPLFTTLADFPDRRTAREVAEKIMQALFDDAGAAGEGDPPAGKLERKRLGRPLSRRALLHGLLQAAGGD